VGERVKKRAKVGAAAAFSRFQDRRKPDPFRLPEGPAAIGGSRAPTDALSSGGAAASLLQRAACGEA